MQSYLIRHGKAAAQIVWRGLSKHPLDKRIPVLAAALAANLAGLDPGFDARLVRTGVVDLLVAVVRREALLLAAGGEPVREEQSADGGSMRRSISGASSTDGSAAFGVSARQGLPSKAAKSAQQRRALVEALNALRNFAAGDTRDRPFASRVLVLRGLYALLADAESGLVHSLGPGSNDVVAHVLALLRACVWYETLAPLPTADGGGGGGDRFGATLAIMQRALGHAVARPEPHGEEIVTHVAALLTVYVAEASRDRRAALVRSGVVAQLIAGMRATRSARCVIAACGFAAGLAGRDAETNLHLLDSGFLEFVVVDALSALYGEVDVTLEAATLLRNAAVQTEVAIALIGWGVPVLIRRMLLRHHVQAVDVAREVCGLALNLLAVAPEVGGANASVWVDAALADTLAVALDAQRTDGDEDVLELCVFCLIRMVQCEGGGVADVAGHVIDAAGEVLVRLLTVDAMGRVCISKKLVVLVLDLVRMLARTEAACDALRAISFPRVLKVRYDLVEFFWVFVLRLWPLA